MLAYAKACGQRRHNSWACLPEVGFGESVCVLLCSGLCSGGALLSCASDLTVPPAKRLNFMTHGWAARWSIGAAARGLRRDTSYETAL